MTINGGRSLFPVSICFFSGLKNGHKMMVSDLNEELRAQTWSKMGGTAPLMLWEGYTGPRSDKYGHITRGRPPKTRIGAHLGRWRDFFDVNQSLGRVKSSDLVQIGRNTSPGVGERCNEPISDKSRSYHLGDVPKNTIWGSFGPLGL